MALAARLDALVHAAGNVYTRSRRSARSTRRRRSGRLPPGAQPLRHVKRARSARRDGRLRSPLSRRRLLRRRAASAGSPVRRQVVAVASSPTPATLARPAWAYCPTGTRLVAAASLPDLAPFERFHVRRPFGDRTNSLAGSSARRRRSDRAGHAAGATRHAWRLIPRSARVPCGASLRGCVPLAFRTLSDGSKLARAARRWRRPLDARWRRARRTVPVRGPPAARPRRCCTRAGGYPKARRISEGDAFSLPGQTRHRCEALLRHARDV